MGKTTGAFAAAKKNKLRMKDGVLKFLAAGVSMHRQAWCLHKNPQANAVIAASEQEGILPAPPAVTAVQQCKYRSKPA